MSFYSARVLKALTGKSGPTSAHQMQQSLKCLRGPQVYEVKAFTLEGSGVQRSEPTRTQGPETTNWKYVKLRKTTHIRVMEHAIILFMLFLPFAVNTVNESRYTLESISKEDPRNSAIGSTHYQDQLE